MPKKSRYMLLKIFHVLSVHKLVVLLGMIIFLVVASSCVYAANPIHHENDTGASTCNLSETISNSVLSRESMGLFMLLTLLALSFSLISSTPYPGRDIYRNLTLLYTIPIHKYIVYKVFDHFLWALRRGIIHPKLYNAHLS